MLYHYTSVQMLALILKTKAIRFNKLSKVNDPRDGCPLNQEMNEQIFVSCWIRRSKDSIPMWKLYAGLDGVRIGLPEDMFTTHPTKLPNHEIEVDGQKKQIKQRVITDILRGPHIKKNFETAAPIHYGPKYQKAILYGPDDINYQPDDLRHVHYTVLKSDEFHKVGLKKHADWAFEQEVRFRIPAGSLVTQKPQQTLKVDGDYIDVGLKEEAFKNIEILTGPANSTANLIIAKALLRDHEIGGEPQKSKIQIRDY
ncbi:DUF2971 domain-containing protein [Pseudovibrio sp. WM33]|uniref:DUF2971 domain-containing protein n=1 Tax=Pseudovibrio sp. WM33 TaxID=1735585 RepID=UPI0007AEE509|nr:DUF2971 domain-containing protein [Pseudovibrio sp. WM33]KZL22366.1 hypothetical protein PsWM33_03964 [Pseudovibrio sp. WM33]